MAGVLSKSGNLRRGYWLFSSYTSSSRFSTNQIPFIQRPLIQSVVIDLSGSFTKQQQQQLTPRFRFRFRFRFLSTSNTQAESAAAGSDSQSNQGGGGGSEQQQGKSVRGAPITWLSLLLLIATGAGVIVYYDQEKKRHIDDINTSSTAVKQGPSAGKAAIGGPFNLVDHNGKAVTENDFKGKWTLVYFGFTHCPDICPDELQKLAAAIDKIKAKAGFEIVPVFISVDPERDTVEQVREYVKEFHPKLIGLTGDPEEVKKAARAYRVYYMKTEEEGSDYLVDHSIIMYLMDPNMEFLKFFGKNNDVDALTEGIINEIKQYKKSKA